MKKFVSWLGGIAAAVIAGVLVYRLTVPPPPPPPAPEILFDGMVIDDERNIPVKDALVSLQVEGVGASDAYHDLTDGNGSYAIKLAGLSKTSPVELRVHANGYIDQTKKFEALIDDNRYDPLLKGVPPPPPPHGGAPTPTPLVPVSVVRPRYIQKLSVQTFKVALQKK